MIGRALSFFGAAILGALALGMGAHAQTINGPVSCPLSTNVPVTASGSTWGCRFAPTINPTAAAAGPVAIGMRNDLTITGNLSNVTGATDFLSGNFTTTFTGVSAGPVTTMGAFQAGLYLDNTNTGITFNGLRAFVDHSEVNCSCTVTLLDGMQLLLTNNTGTISNLRWLDVPDTRSTPGGGTISNEWALYSPNPNAKVEIGGPIRSLTSFQFMSAFGTNSTKMTSSTDGVVLTAKSTGAQLTVSGLPSCTSGLDGARAFVTDATATTFASSVAGSGSNHVPVYCDGGATAWKIG